MKSMVSDGNNHLPNHQHSYLQSYESGHFRLLVNGNSMLAIEPLGCNCVATSLVAIIRCDCSIGCCSSCCKGCQYCLLAQVARAQRFYLLELEQP